MTTAKKKAIPVPTMYAPAPEKAKQKVTEVQYIVWDKFDMKIGMDVPLSHGVLDDLNDLMTFCRERSIDVSEVQQELTSGYPPHYCKRNNVSFGRVEDLVTDDTPDTK